MGCRRLGRCIVFVVGVGTLSTLGSPSPAASWTSIAGEVRVGSPGVLQGDMQVEDWPLLAGLLTRVDANRLVRMRDGVGLDTTTLFPKKDVGKLPTILWRTPYSIPWRRTSESTARQLRPFLERGYAVVFQNERGTFWSEGTQKFLAGARHDGYDTVDWISNRPWSNGKVGAIGCSSSAEHQLGLSAMNHPAFAAAIAQAPGAGVGVAGPYHEQGHFYRGGAVQLLWPMWYWTNGQKQRPRFPADISQAERTRLARAYPLESQLPLPADIGELLSWLPIKDILRRVDGPITDFDDFVQRTPGDPRWEETDFGGDGDRFGAPMLWLFSWYDVGVAPNIALYNHARDNGWTDAAGQNQYMVISPVEHCAFGRETEHTIIGERDVGDARFDYDSLFVDWFDYWLKDVDNGVTDRPRVQTYMMGGDEWVSSDEFPRVGTRPHAYYLHSDGGANRGFEDGRLSTDRPIGQEPVDEYLYDPANPTPSVGGSVCCTGGLLLPGAFDQRALETRNDVLVYTTPPLEEGVEVTGFVDVVLYVSSDARDTDFTAKLIDVYPDGTAYNLDDSIQRARYREGYDQTVLMTKGEVYELHIGPLATSNWFAPGHRIRLEISSSNFPHFERNLNTGGNNYDESGGIVALNRIHHSAEHPSHVVLPIAPASAARLSGQMPQR